MAAMKQVFIKISQQDVFGKYENNKLLERLSCLRQDCGSKGDEGLVYQTDGVGQVQPGHPLERGHWELRIHSHTNSPFAPDRAILLRYFNENLFHGGHFVKCKILDSGQHCLFDCSYYTLSKDI